MSLTPDLHGSKAPADTAEHESPMWERLPVEFGESIFQGAVQTPWNGVAQMFHLPEMHLVGDQKANSGADWVAQQVGGALGMAASFYALHEAGRAVGGKLGLGGAATDIAAKDPIPSVGEQMFSSTGHGIIAGGAYGLIFQPVQSARGSSFWSERFANAGSMAATFGVMNGLGTGIMGLGTSDAFKDKFAGSLLRNDAVAGVASGLPGGFVGAESNSLLNGKGLATSSDLTRSMLDYAVVGGALGAGSEILAKHAAPDGMGIHVTHSDDGITLLLDGGGARGWGHIGVLRYLEKNNVPIDQEYGVSIGALVATLHANHYSADQVQGIFDDEFHNPDVLKYLPKTGSRAELLRFVNIEPLMRYFVDKYDLKPQDNLHIVTYNLRRREPVMFEGGVDENGAPPYDLAKAMAASVSIPGPFRWVRYNATDVLGVPKSKRGLRLLDGGIKQITADQLPPGNIVISRLLTDNDPGLFNTVFGEKWGPRIETLLTKSGIKSGNSGSDDGNQGAMVIQTGDPKVTSLGFALPDERLYGMVDYGEEQAGSTLGPAVSDGRLPTSAPEPQGGNAEPPLWLLHNSRVSKAPYFENSFSWLNNLRSRNSPPPNLSL